MDAGSGLTVALDVTARIAGSTGVARYVAELDRALTEQGVRVRRYAIGRGIFPAPAGTRRVPIPLRVAHGLWSATGRPRIDRVAPAADVIHTADLVAPPARRPSVVTVHDLDAIEHPSLHHPRAVAQQQAQVASLHRANVVIANSETTRGALLRHGARDDAVVVAHLGLTALPEVEPATFERIDQYVLCVGTLDLRKGQDVLVRAWARLSRPRTALILVGPDGQGADQIRSDASTGQADVRFLGRVDDGRLAALYRGAAAVAVPSRAEGFGMPALEAMALGIPVVASDLDAVREVTGGAAWLVAPEDEGSLAEALEAALLGAADVQAHAAAGRERAARFSWSECAAITIAAYRQAVGGTDGPLSGR